MALLRSAGLDPAVRPADIDETPSYSEDEVSYVSRLAAAKALAVPRTDGEVVLAADTAVVVDGDVLGKPLTAERAVAMLRRLSGRTHTVTTAVAVVIDVETMRQTVVSTEVVFTELADAAVAAYVATGEPLDKAGAYAIQERAAAFVERIDGSYTNVVGLPLVETLRLLPQLAD